MPRRKPEKTVNLVRPQSSDTYRIVPDFEMLQIRDRVVFERARQQDNMFGYFYFDPNQ